MSEKKARLLFSEAQKFFSRLADAGWYVSDSVVLDDSKSPLDLFASQERPLVVGLFGGTGVGKSSLLNRLAGVDIARTGVVRPTSMEITAYLHDDVQLEALPDHFDASRFSANRHSNDQLAEVMWVDMPDFDSDEIQNRDQVLTWLPHIDLVIYVVTPERYKDAEGWRMMLENGYQHAWVFIINQWDKAEQVQYEDFVALLAQAGFESPQVFRTVCGLQHDEDQFISMLEVIKSLAQDNVIKHLQERGWMHRLRDVQRSLAKRNESLSCNDSLALESSFKLRWQEFKTAAAAHLDAPFKAHSTLFAEERTNAVNRVLKSLKSSASTTDVVSNVAARTDAGLLWDDWLSVRLQDCVQQLQLADREHGVPKNVLSFLNEGVAENSSDLMARHLSRGVESTIASPGTSSQRIVSKTASVLKLLLPLAALVWVTWRVLNGFIAGAEDRTAYVGVDFLVNGVLLAGLGWLIPYAVEKIFVPSMPDSVYRALHRGLQSGLTEFEQSMYPALKTISEDRQQFLQEVSDLQDRIDRFLANSSSLTTKPVLGKVLMREADS